MIDILNTLSHEAFLVYVVLKERAQSAPKQRLIIDTEYLAITANIGLNSITRALNELVATKFIDYDGTKFHLNDVAVTIKPTRRAEKTLMNLEAEIARLEKLLATSQGHDLASALNGDTKIFVEEVEDYMGRSLLAGEIFYLGGLIFKYGVGRVRLAYRQVRDDRFPIRSMWGMLQNGKFGSGKEAKEEASVSYGSVGNAKDL